MKSLATIIALCGILFSVLGCDAGKSGPFTFTNKTEAEVNVIITQDGTVEKKFTTGEKYDGKDYYNPTITFVKGLSSADDKKIIDNRYTYTTANGFDYEFGNATSTPINISINLPTDFTTTYPDFDKWYLAEANGKLGDYSNVTVRLSEIQTPPASPTGYKLYTSAPEFGIYRDKTVDGKTERENLTGLFSLSQGKIELPPATDTADAKPTLQWNLEITYPKVEPVE